MYFTMNTYDNIPRNKNVAHWLVETKSMFSTLSTLRGGRREGRLCIHFGLHKETLTSINQK